MASKKRRIISLLLTVIMVFTFSFENTYMVQAANENDANSSGNNGPVEENFSVMSLLESSLEGITLNMGNQSIVGENEYAFGNAEVIGDGIRSLVVLFTDKAEAGDVITLPSRTGFELQNETSDYKIVKIAEGTATADVQDYIRNIKFTLAGVEKEVQITVSKSVVNSNTYYNYTNRHYYQYISSAVPWTTAYSNAASMQFAGRNGYLATVTNATEDKYILGLTGNTGWLGGTRLKKNASGSFNTSGEQLSSSAASTENANPWYWACGPEKDKVFYKTAVCSPKPYSEYTGWLKNFLFYKEGLKIDLLSWDFSGNFYWNWNRDSYANYQPDNVRNGMGSCLVTKGTGKGWSTGEGQAWYDEAYASASKVSGYYVEYGDATVGDSTENCENTGVVTVRKMQREATPYISIDYVEEELKGFDVTKSYTVNGVAVENISSMGTVAINPSWYGTSLNIVMKGDGSLTADSNVFVLAIPSKPSEPTGITGYNRTLSGVDATMEFRPEGSTVWTKVSGSKIQRLAAGSYEIRVSATNTSFKSNIATVEVLDTGASISINTNKKVDVALAVGSTGVDYSNFETDLRSYIANHDTYKAIKQEDLNIMATNAVDTSGKSEFTWLQFDHSNASSIYDSSNNPYIDNVNIITTQSTNAYNSKNYHIVSADNGTNL